MRALLSNLDGAIAVTTFMPDPSLGLGMRAIRPLPLLFLPFLVAACASAPPPEPARPSPPAPVALRLANASPPPPPARPSDPPDVVSAKDEEPCEPGEVYIPATGDQGFTMGRGVSLVKGDVPHKVILTHAFCIDANEVSGRDWASCVAAKKCTKNLNVDEWSNYEKFPDRPVSYTDWDQAHGYCEWRGKRLPTEAEWEWAASGPDGTHYPWGNEPEPTCEHADFTHGGAPKWRPSGDVGCQGGGPSEVGAHPKGDKVWPGGHIHDLAGNVWEWVEDSFVPTYPTGTVTDPLVRQESAIHGIRGGAWNRAANSLDTAFRASAHYEYTVPGLGFRCVRGAPHPTPPPRQKKWWQTQGHPR
jgi:serine/threonine-protein kinase